MSDARLARLLAARKARLAPSPERIKRMAAGQKTRDQSRTAARPRAVR